jgi:hypothetical protein
VTTLDSKWVKAASADGQITTTGGALTHGHTASSCQPVQNAHDHPSVQDLAVTGATTGNGLGLNQLANDTHMHTWTVGSETATNNSVAVNINTIASGAALPLHRTVIYVKFNGVSIVSAVYTSYDLNRFIDTETTNRVSEEVEAKIRMGDRRFMRQEDPL